MRRKGLLFATLVSVLALVLAGCECPEETPAPTQAPADTPTPEAPETVNLQMMIVDYIPDVTDTWLEEDVIPAFQEDYPNVNVELVLVSWGTLDETVQGYYAAGAGADIINLGAEYIVTYGDRLVALDDYYADLGLDLDQFVPGTMDNVTWDGAIRGLPWLTAPRAYMCRMDMLGDSGYDAIPGTFDEFVQMVSDVTVIEGGAISQKGFQATGASAMVNSTDWQQMIELIWAVGGELYAADGTPQFDSDESRAVLEFMYDLHHAMFTDSTIADIPEVTGAPLSTDSPIACMWANLWGLPSVDDPVYDLIDFAASPTDSSFAGATPVSTVFNDWLGIPDYSENPAEAAAFLAFLGSAENLNTYNGGFGSFPPRQDAWTGYVQDSAPMLAVGDLMADYGMPFADVRESAQLRDILNGEVGLYLADAQGLETTIENVQTQYTDVLQAAGLID